VGVLDVEVMHALGFGLVLIGGDFGHNGFGGRLLGVGRESAEENESRKTHGSGTQKNLGSSEASYQTVRR
jgi:hypothetical protein